MKIYAGKAIAAACLLFAQVSTAQTLGLYDVYLLALDSDPQLRIANHQMAMVTERHVQERGRLMPQVNLSMNYSENDLSYPDTSQPDQDYAGKRNSLTIRQTLFNWELIARKAAAKEDMVQREYELIEAMNTLLMQVAQRYLEVLIAGENVKLLAAELKLAVKQQAAVEKRHERGLAPITELLETRSVVDTIRVNQIDARNTFDTAKENLRELAGREVDDLAPLKKERSLPRVVGNVDFHASKALANSPRIAAKYSALRASRKRVSARQGARLPKLDLVLNHQDSDVGFDNQLTPRRKSEYAAIEFTLPLFSGGTNLASVREARYQEFIAGEELELIRRQASKTAREAYLNASSGYQRIQASATALASSSESFKAMEKGFELGAVTMIDVLEASRQRTQAQRDYQKARYTYVYYYLNLKKETGLITANDLEMISASFEGG